MWSPYGLFRVHSVFTAELSDKRKIRDLQSYPVPVGDHGKRVPGQT